MCHNISRALDNGDEITSVFLIFRLNKTGISGSLLKWLENYVYCRQQYVVIQGQKSTYRHRQTDRQTEYLFSKFIISAVNYINNDLLVIQEWSQQWLVQVSIEKSVFMLISKRNSPTMAEPILFESAVLQNVSCHKHIGSRGTSMCHGFQTDKYDAHIEI